MYPRSFLCEEAKIKHRTPLKKELCEIGAEAIWESRFTSFFPRYIHGPYPDRSESVSLPLKRVNTSLSRKRQSERSFTEDHAWATIE